MTIADAVERSQARNDRTAYAAKRNEAIVSDLYKLARKYDLKVITLFRIWRAAVKG